MDLVTLKGARSRAAIALAGAMLASTVVAGMITLVPATPASAAPVGCSTDVYFVVGTGSPLTTPNSLTRRAPDGTLTSISTPGLNPWTIGMNPVDGNLYAFQYESPGNHLFRVEGDGNSIDLGAVAGGPGDVLLSVGGFDDSGTFWVSSSTNLYGIDVETMTATSVPLSQGVGGDLAFIDGAIYASTNPVFPGTPDLARIDPATGTVTVVDLPGMISAPSFWAVDGHLYISQNTDLVEVLDYDTATPTRLVVGSGTTGFTGIARDGASCPTGPSPFLNAADDDYTANPLTPEGGIAGNVFGNDTENGAAVSPAGVTATVTDDGGLTGVTIGADGAVTVPAGTSAGTYALRYDLCSIATPTLCDPAVATVVVGAAGPDPAVVTGAADRELPPTGTESGWLAGMAVMLLAAGAALFASVQRSVTVRRSGKG